MFFKKFLTEERDGAQSLLVQLDGRSMSLESGRYMETVGKKCQYYFSSSFLLTCILGWLSMSF